MNKLEQERILREGWELRQEFVLAAAHTRASVARQEDVRRVALSPQLWQALMTAIQNLHGHATLQPLEQHLLNYASHTHPIIRDGMQQDVPGYAEARAQWHLAQSLLLAIYGDPGAQGEVQMLLERAPQVLEKLGLTINDLPTELRNLPPAPWYQKNGSPAQSPATPPASGSPPFFANRLVPRRSATPTPTRQVRQFRPKPSAPNT